MIFQNYALYPHMSAYDNMAFGLKLRKVPKDERRSQGDAHGVDARARPRCCASGRGRSRAGSGSASRWGGRSSASRRHS